MDVRKTVEKIRKKYRHDAFSENDHPRDENGRFTSGGGNSDFQKDYDGLKNFMIENARKNYLPEYKNMAGEGDLSRNEKNALNAINRINDSVKRINEIKKSKKENPGINYHGEKERKKDIDWEMNELETALHEYEKDGYGYEAEVYRKALDIAKKITKGM